MYGCRINLLIFDSNNIVYLLVLNISANNNNKKGSIFSEILFLGHSEVNKICHFNLSLVFSIFAWVSIANIFKWAVGIGLPSRKREPRKMGVCPLTQCTIFFLLQNISP